MATLASEEIIDMEPVEISIRYDFLLNLDIHLLLDK